MPNEKQTQMQNALHKQIEEIDKLYLRRMRKEMYDCASNCCSNNNDTMENVNGCISQCSMILESTSQFVSSQFDNYQNRLQRCITQCNDEAKDQLGVYPTEKEIQSASKNFESCAGKCVDKHMGLLPQFMSKIHEVLGPKMPPEELMKNV